MKNGVFLAILSSLIFSIMNALVKAVSFTIPSSEIVFFRSLIGTVLIYYFMRKSKVAFSTEGIPLLVLRGVLGALYLLTYFYTISKIPLVDASILVHLSPFFVILFSMLFLKEKLDPKLVLLLPVVIIGAVFIIKPFEYSSYSIYALIGILSAALAAGASVTIRQLTKKHHSYEIVFYFLATATLVSIPLMWNNFIIPTLTEMFYLLCIGVVSLLGQVFLTQAFTHENAAVVAVTRYIGIVFNAMWGFLFWTEIPDVFTVIGGTLIVVSCIALSWKKPVKVKQSVVKNNGS